MKRALSILGQSLVLVVTAFTGLLLRPFHLTHILGQEGFVRRQYEFDWILSVGLMYLVFLLIGLIAKRIRTSWISSTVAFVLTVLLLALFTKIGFKDANLLYGAN